MRERQNRIAEERHRCTNSGRMTRIAATAYRAEILHLLRETGDATTSDIAHAFNTTCKAVRAHLHVLLGVGAVNCEVSYHGSRRDYLWHAVESRDA